MAIQGASRFINASTLANTQGRAAAQSTLLGEGSTANLLELGRTINSGLLPGLSSSARAVNQQFLSQSDSINSMFSYGVGVNATVEGMKQQILALRAGLSEGQLAPSLRGGEVDTEA